ncbi:MAG: MBL fold metallo-hydrolase [Gammaproteobacteria bacterium]|nr:MBL fold metallo-hydrolase [Gammaproteobacteria bacterium]
MGPGNAAAAQPLAAAEGPPGESEFELTLLGPGYGESIVLHIGGGDWLIVDSCVNAGGIPRAIEYLEGIGVDPGRQVKLIVATHWHDDHVRGIAELFTRCENARFCCAAALRTGEFLAAVQALESRHLSVAGSGVREMFGVFSELRKRTNMATFAQANRRIFSSGPCEIWSLSPSDAQYQSFVESVGTLVPVEGGGKRRVQASGPNSLSVVLWIRLGEAIVLLGADLEKPGWAEILKSRERPAEKASVFKIPHHGSRNAHEPGVWREMLDPAPVAALTPWRRGGASLPGKEDAERILSLTENAYASAGRDAATSSGRKRVSAVERTIRESGISLRHSAPPCGAVRLRRNRKGGAEWRATTLGAARHLREYFK